MIRFSHLRIDLSQKYSLFSETKGVPIKEARKADQVRVTWNDYPGEWFEEGPRRNQKTGQDQYF